jgi:hypothetical protein
MKWVKANDRLPLKSTLKDEFFIRYNGKFKTTAKFHYTRSDNPNPKFVFREGTFPGKNMLLEDKFYLIEWLDESDESLLLEVLQDFVQDYTAWKEDNAHSDIATIYERAKRAISLAVGDNQKTEPENTIYNGDIQGEREMM